MAILKLFSVAALALLACAGCNKKTSTVAAPTPPAKTSPSPSATAASSIAEDTTVTFDACTLLTKEEVAATQGTQITDTKSSERGHDAIRVSQCYYSASESSKSVNIGITRGRTGAGAQELWDRMFGQRAKSEGEKGEREEKEKSPPPQKIEGLGEEAFWVASHFGGMLYVRKGGAYVFVSVGGPDKIEGKLEKSKTLAEKALPRM